MYPFTSLLSQPIVCVDIETTGMNYVNGHVIEVAAIRIENGEIVDSFNSLINPGVEVPYFITKLTGIKTADVGDAPTFADIATQLFEIMNGALFVAHNVRFDYSFLKQEFRRVEIDFNPKQLCTVKLSRALYPDQTSHKLASLIERYQFTYDARHRAYDDAHVVWQFLQKTHQDFSSDVMTAAITRQLRSPHLPKHVQQSDIDRLPIGPGVYTFHDEHGAALYIGKSINIRRRVMSHFTRDSEEYKEFKIAQSVYSITAQETGGELAALLLESQLIKTVQPLHNRMLRRVRTLTAITQTINADGYIQTTLDEIDHLEPESYDHILALYPRRRQAKESLLRLVKTFDLCPKLCGIEKTKGACFSYQLAKCKGACIGKESPELYNRRLLMAFADKMIERWPYPSAVLIQENPLAGLATEGFVVDQWRIVATITQEEDCEPQIQTYKAAFDFDAYKILRSFVISRASHIRVSPFDLSALDS
ncbi:MAG: exonuclease domain-containing protein [Candidatus Saccharimonadales bacterium]